MGDRTERAFVRAFSGGDDFGWYAQRAAASGSATENELPDVTFAHDGIAFAAEEKTVSRSTKYIRLDQAEVDALRRYAAAYGMRPVIIGRWKGERAFYLWHPQEMYRTDSGNYRGGRYSEEYPWAAKIADPAGEADGVLPADLSGPDLAHALNTRLSSKLDEPYENSEGAYPTSVDDPWRVSDA